MKYSKRQLRDVRIPEDIDRRFSVSRRRRTTWTVSARASPLFDARDERESNEKAKKDNLNTGWVLAAGDSGRSLVTAGVFQSSSSGGKTARAWNERCARGVVGDHGTAPVDRPASGHRDKRGGCACEKGRRDRVGERAQRRVIRRARPRSETVSRPRDARRPVTSGASARSWLGTARSRARFSGGSRAGETSKARTWRNRVGPAA